MLILSKFLNNNIFLPKIFGSQNNLQGYLSPLSIIITIHSHGFLAILLKTGESQQKSLSTWKGVRSAQNIECYWLLWTLG